MRAIALQRSNALAGVGVVVKPHAPYGGEESLVLAEQTLEGALVVCERMREAVHGLGLAHPDAEAGVVTISIGAAACPHAGETDSTDAIRRADLALYAAKALGRDRVVADA